MTAIKTYPTLINLQPTTTRDLMIDVYSDPNKEEHDKNSLLSTEPTNEQCRVVEREKLHRMVAKTVDRKHLFQVFRSEKRREKR